MSRYDKNTFIDPRRFIHQISISSNAGAGSSTLLARLKERYAGLPYRFASGGDMMRARASKLGFPSIEALIEHIRRFPGETDHDAWCENILRTFATHDYYVCESRLAHINTPYAFKVLLDCPTAICASRMGKSRRNKDFPGLSTEQIVQELEQRNTSDWERYENLYPGCKWAPEDFDLVVDTSLYFENMVEYLVLEGHKRWLATLDPEQIFHLGCYR